MQMEELKQAVRSGINMDDICNPKFSHSVMREIRLASELNYDLTRYAKLGYSGEVLRQIRLAKGLMLLHITWLDFHQDR